MSQVCNHRAPLARAAQKPIVNASPRIPQADWASEGPTESSPDSDSQPHSVCSPPSCLPHSLTPALWAL